MNPVKQQKILILGAFSYSLGEAPSNYVIGMGHAFRCAGFEVHYLSSFLDLDRMREEFKPFVCHTPSSKHLSTYTGYKRVWARLWGAGNEMLKWLMDQPDREYTAVVVYPDSTCTVGFMSHLQRWCELQSCKLIAVAVEWPGFRYSHWTQVHNNLLALVDSEWRLRVMNKRAKSVIAVSSYIEKFYSSADCNVVRIPPLIDAASPKWTSQPQTRDGSKTIKLLFSGSWARDRLDLVAKAVLKVRQEGFPIVLEFLGSSDKDLGAKSAMRDTISKAPAGTFVFHGRVPVERVIPISSSVDFCILFRKSTKWSNACFPSKVAEFQALGIPIMCNLTSDLADYLVDGKNSLLVPDLTVDAFAATVKRAFDLSPADRQAMRQRSLECAAKCFDFRQYSQALREFVHKA